MKRMWLIAVLAIYLSCSEAERSHTETAHVVVESFYEKDFPILEEHTTAESFGAFMSINDIVLVAETKDSQFKVIQETMDGDIAWVRFTTAYEEKPEVFKLNKEGGRWKVTEIALGEKGPF